MLTSEYISRDRELCLILESLSDQRSIMDQTVSGELGFQVEKDSDYRLLRSVTVQWEVYFLPEEVS